jgi:high-affinity iron transporter
MNFTAALPTFVITLREGFEATLVVGIVLACLSKAGQSNLNNWVYGGAIAGIFTSIFLGLVLGVGIQQLGQRDGIFSFAISEEIIPVIQEVLAGTFTLGAIILLSWMLLWMTQQAASLKGEVQTAVTDALKSSATGWGVFSLSFLAVTREGFETVLFLLTQFGSGAAPVVGAIAGFLLAILLGILLFQGGVKINIRQFFQVMGVLLLLIVAGLVTSSFHAFDKAAEILATLATLSPDYPNLCFSTDSCILGKQVWDLSSVLSDRQFPGILLKALFGYRDHLYLAQFLGYSIFLVSASVIYFSSLQTQPTSSK